MDITEYAAKLEEDYKVGKLSRSHQAQLNWQAEQGVFCKDYAELEQLRKECHEYLLSLYTSCIPNFTPAYINQFVSTYVQRKADGTHNR